MDGGGARKLPMGLWWFWVAEKVAEHSVVIKLSLKHKQSKGKEGDVWVRGGE